MSKLLLFSIFTFIVGRCFSLNLSEIKPPCASEIYCSGPLLHAVQMVELFRDSKTFVDMSLRTDLTPEKVIQEYEKENYTEPEDLRVFVMTYFEEGNELESWNPPDWTSDPKFLKKIQDRKLRKWAQDLNVFWNRLGRKIKDEVRDYPERFSIIYVSNGIIVPGGRFREFYYWDSYWIQIGLFHSEMSETVKGMIDNFLEMVEHDEYGFVPNGGRVYYRRSQPPLLIPMVKNYVDYVGGQSSIEYLTKNLPTLEKEFLFWEKNRMVEVKDKNNNVHRLAIYNSIQNQPRPESYREDYELVEKLHNETLKERLYTDLHSGAESGWDFSSRWWSVPKGETGDLAHTRTTNVIPVDLNAFLYLNARLLSGFYKMVKDTEKEEIYRQRADILRDAIMGILWDDEDGCWYDYDREKEELRRHFYVSNVIPLWAGVNDTMVDKVVRYLELSTALKYEGGIPTSLQQTGEQWDFPNGWAPLQHLVIDALAKSESQAAKDIAFDIAKKWTLGNFKFYEKRGIMLEKYDVTTSGSAGGGGEYEVVIGFGWTNGVILDLLDRYGDRLKVDHELGGNAPHLSSFSFIVIMMSSISILIGSYWGARWLQKRCSGYNNEFSFPNKTGSRGRSLRTELPFAYNLTTSNRGSLNHNTVPSMTPRPSIGGYNTLVQEDKETTSLLI